MTLPVVDGLVCAIESYVAIIRITRPEKKNAFSEAMWAGLATYMRLLSQRTDVRVVLLEGSEQFFSSGMDTAFLLKLGSQLSAVHEDEARKRLSLLTLIESLQETVRAMAACPHPVIASMNGLVMGAAMDLMSVCDIRLCSRSAQFSVKEIDWSIPADLGVLYYLPRIMSSSRAHEWIMTGRMASAQEAMDSGLCSYCAEDAATLETYARRLASEIAQKSPVAMQGIKRHLQYNQQASFSESLTHIAQWNASFLSEQDIKAAGFAFLQGQTAQFKDVR